MNSDLLERFLESVSQLAATGRPVEAIRFYHEVTLESLADSKALVDQIRAGQFVTPPKPGLKMFFSLLESKDFHSAAASLCVYQHLQLDQAIESTVRISKKLGSTLNMPELSAIDETLSTSADSVERVRQLALPIVREKMILSLMNQDGSSRDDATQLIDQVLNSMPQNASVRPEEALVHHDQLKPPKDGVQSTSELGKSSLAKSVRQQNQPTQLEAVRWLSRLAKLTSIAYALLALTGLVAVAYSFATAPNQLEALRAAEYASTDQQAQEIAEWSNRNLPATLTWFFPVNRFISFRLEPGLPAEYDYLELPWDQKLENLNRSAEATIATFKKCHTLLLVFYLFSFALAAWYFVRADLVTGLLMTLPGLLGVPFLTAGFVRMDLENSFWLAPLLVPAAVAVVISIATMVLIPSRTTSQQELRRFWFGVLAFVVGTAALGIAIAYDSHLRPNAGVALFGGLLLMLRHGWAFLRAKMRSV